MKYRRYWWANSRV